MPEELCWLCGTLRAIEQAMEALCPKLEIKPRSRAMLKHDKVGCTKNAYLERPVLDIRKHPWKCVDRNIRFIAM